PGAVATASCELSVSLLKSIYLWISCCTFVTVPGTETWPGRASAFRGETARRAFLARRWSHSCDGAWHQGMAVIGVSESDPSEVSRERDRAGTACEPR